MQTNREDVGKRYLEIEIPVPPNASRATEVSAPLRDYYKTLAAARTELPTYLGSANSHHFFVAGSADIAEIEEVEIVPVAGS